MGPNVEWCSCFENGERFEHRKTHKNNEGLKEKLPTSSILIINL